MKYRIFVNIYIILYFFYFHLFNFIHFNHASGLCFVIYLFYSVDKELYGQQHHLFIHLLLSDIQSAIYHSSHAQLTKIY